MCIPNDKEVRRMKIVRSNLRLGQRLGGGVKGHSSMNGMTIAAYIGNLIYDDLKKRYPELMKDVPRSEAYIPQN